METAVLARSARRCTLCFHLTGDLKEKLGQIAHLDDDPSNRAEVNLAWMCLEHHSLYDSKTKQHKNYTIAEVKKARDKLYGAIASGEHLAHSKRARAKANRERAPGKSKRTNIGKRPKVVATKYGNLPNGKEALHLHNEGDVAHAVRADDLKLGEWVVKFDELSLLKNEGHLAVASIQKITHLENAKHIDTIDSLDYAWRDAQRPGLIERLPIHIFYKDFESNEFRAVCSLERDVLVRGSAPFRITNCQDELAKEVRPSQPATRGRFKPTLVDRGPGNTDPVLPGFKRTYIVGMRIAN